MLLAATKIVVLTLGNIQAVQSGIDLSGQRVTANEGAWIKACVVVAGLLVQSTRRQTACAKPLGTDIAYLRWIYSAQTIFRGQQLIIISAMAELQAMV